MKKIFILLIFMTIICGCASPSSNMTKSTLNIINEAKNSARQRTMELIASTAKVAYTSYIYKTMNTSELESSCDFMNEVYFNYGLSVNCVDNTTTIITEDGSTYIATYKDGIMNINDEDGTLDTVTVRIKE